MPVIRPFKGISYDKKKVDELAKVITPPYDVIDAEAQTDLYELSPYNVIRLEYGAEYKSDSAENNRYTRAAQVFREWLQDGILKTDACSCYYLYEQTFTVSDKEYRRSGIFAALKLEPYEKGNVLPHELTMSAPKADRLKLLGETGTNISPIFTLFPDPESKIKYLSAEVKNNKPIAEARESTGEAHRLWRISDKGSINLITECLHEQPLLIADGHHRYETALEYCRLNSNSSSPGPGYILTVMVSMQDEGLIVLPTHRLLHNLHKEDLIFLNRVIDEHFLQLDLGELSDLDTAKFNGLLKKAGTQGLSMGYMTQKKAAVLTSRKKGETEDLAVSLLHDLLLKPLTSQSVKAEKGGEMSLLSYPHDLDSVLKSLRKAEADCAFILEPIPVETILFHARHGRVMPQKSTFFYPKLPSGLLMYHHDLSY